MEQLSAYGQLFGPIQRLSSQVGQARAAHTLRSVRNAKVAAQQAGWAARVEELVERGDILGRERVGHGGRYSSWSRVVGLLRVSRRRLWRGLRRVTEEQVGPL